MCINVLVDFLLLWTNIDKKKKQVKGHKDYFGSLE